MKLENFDKRRQTLIITILLASIIFMMVVFGYMISETAIAPNFETKNMPPSFQHPFGTDWLGRDLFLRTIKGLSISITLGVVACFLSGILAFLAGSIAASGSKTVDNIFNWITDLSLSIPHTILLILISFAVGKGLKGILIGIVVTHWASLARVIRGEVLQLRNEEYIKISRKFGKSRLWIIRNHFLPYVLPQLIIGMVLLFPHAILHEASITFLGFGLSPEQPAIGIIISESMEFLFSGMWWLTVFPGLMLVIVVLMVEKIGSNMKKLLNTETYYM